MIIAGTGHRPDKLGGYNDKVKSKLVYLAEVGLKMNEPYGVISGMALGWDQALAIAAIELGIPLLAALPFKNQDCKWPDRSRKEYKNILSKADKIVIVSDGEYSASKMQKRNKWMVDNCDLLLALWNGSFGGTANCIEYANSVNRKIINMWSNYEI